MLSFVARTVFSHIAFEHLSDYFLSLPISFGGLSGKPTQSAGGISQFTRPRPPGRLQIPRARRLQKAPLLHPCTSCCSPAYRSAAQGMESTFWSVQVKRAWDSVPPQVQEAQPPLLPIFSEDRGPWPLPFYPVLGVFPSESGDDHEQPLPGCIGDFAGIYPRTDPCGIQSILEPSVPEPVTAVHEEQPEKTRTPGPREDAAEEPFTVAMQPSSCSRAAHHGDDAKDTETSGGSCSRECQQAATRDWTSRLCPLSGLLECIRSGLSCLLRGCCLGYNGSREP